jgi:glycosyltransferase involved in cell wall biosynthesis
MKNLLTICIPTYKRPQSLRRCIKSVISQIENYSLEDDVSLYVVNDASPDETESILADYQSLAFFKGVTREKNLGMNVNIKTMFEEVKGSSMYHLIITDDDYLQPDILLDIIEFLSKQNEGDNQNAVIWTPRYSYTEDGNLHCIACNPFTQSKRIKSSVYNAAKYMHNGFVLSGLILKAECIDYEFWEEYDENAYFPVLFTGDIIVKKGAYYWDKNIVHHTVLNECHWERWGKNDIVIDLRLFKDYIVTYGIMANKLENILQVIIFYLASFTAICNSVYSLFSNNMWNGDVVLLGDAVDEFELQKSPKLSWQLRLIMVVSLLLFTIKSVIKIFIKYFVVFRCQDEVKRKFHRKSKADLFVGIMSVKPIFKLIF